MPVSLARSFALRRSLTVVVAGACLAAASPAAAQRADSARASATPAPTPAPTTAPAQAVVKATPAADSLPGFRRPPLSPGRAFLYSLLVPGYSQWVLGRPTAGAIFVTAEAIGLTMVRESRANLADARRFRGDSIFVRYVNPATGQPELVRERAQADSQLVRVRKAQVEDWIAALLATHLFAGLDAFVAAHLWDIPAQVTARPVRGGAVVAARLRY